ncbi:MAG: molecular chaperone TorD family protein [Selenomonas sp.]|uniref:TorD/DmsD family molecular chaperone n=1 Tax=Selenomonas sp. TaxID=2053611 RepID=UPI0025E77F57|nr:molecular chaperone TorD family protein [Selenomonas sp.]MCR5756700.1 molecular chaperone TorD family protein [Selenomonas sp.]
MEEMRNWRQKAVIYRKLAAFYAGDVDAGQDAIKQIGQLLRISLLVPSLDDEGRYDFNRLFVGPQKLLAPPLESYYRNADHLPMQAETMAVRGAYEEAGLTLAARNRIPDDHAQFEFYFLSCLLEAISRYQGEALAGQAAEQYRCFLQEHLLLWVFMHLRAVEKGSASEYCRAVAGALYQFMRWEKEAVSHEI